MSECVRSTSHYLDDELGNTKRKHHPPLNYPNAHLEEGLIFCGYHEIPQILPCQDAPPALIAASEMNYHLDKDPESKWVHFYEDDQKIQRFWNRIEDYRDTISQFAGVIGPDFSIYKNMRRAAAIENTARNYLLTAHMQQHWGIKAIANVRLQGPDSVQWALAGVPECSTLAIATHGCLTNDNRANFAEEVRIVTDAKQPVRIVCYGSPSTVFDYAIEQGVEVLYFEADTYQRAPERQEHSSM